MLVRSLLSFETISIRWAVISLSNNYGHEYAQVRLTKCVDVLKYLLKLFCNGPPMIFLVIAVVMAY